MNSNFSIKSWFLKLFRSLMIWLFWNILTDCCLFNDDSLECSYRPDYSKAFSTTEFKKAFVLSFAV